MDTKPLEKEALNQISALLLRYGYKCADLSFDEDGADIIGQLSADKHDALKSFRLLKGIINDLDQRNEVWIPISNALYLADYFIVRRFLLWQDRYMMRIEDWIDAVSHFDALVSMATFRFNETEATDVELVDADEVVYEACGLYHPFLGQQAVRNYFSIADQHYYIVTGANWRAREPSSAPSVSTMC